jgi:uncharacterized membrane-anchored protein YhcB (DUF1043 family)
MDQLQVLLRYAQANPGLVAGTVAGLLILWRLLGRRSKLSRAADEQMERLRRQRGDYYTKVRPLR